MIHSCPACGKKNRIPSEHLADTGRCGACRAELPPISGPLDVDAMTFDEIVKGARVPVLIDFSGIVVWTVPHGRPEVKKVAEEMAGHAIVLKVDTEKHPQVAQRFNVVSIPNFVVMKNGKIVRQQPGLVDHSQMAAWLRQAAT